MTTLLRIREDVCHRIAPRYQRRGELPIPRMFDNRLPPNFFCKFRRITDPERVDIIISYSTPNQTYSLAQKLAQRWLATVRAENGRLDDDV